MVAFISQFCDIGNNTISTAQMSIILITSTKATRLATGPSLRYQMQHVFLFTATTFTKDLLRNM